MQADVEETCRGKSRLDKRKRGEGMLGKGGGLARYTTGVANEPEEDEEEENTAGNHKQPARKPFGGSQGW